MKAKSIMLQGTSSNVGKSVLSTALCKIFREDGFRVAPFKSQNMALNSYVTIDGGEIGRAQGAQAEAAGVVATVAMNPVLIKPKQDQQAQVIVLGKPLGDMSAKSYRTDYLPKARSLVKECLDQLREEYEVLVIEGAGSPAEVNLKDGDIVNMTTAKLADSPVLLVADIDRGGVFASLIGTLELLTPEERNRVAGFIINKFRGDLDLLKPGLDFLERRTGKPVLGVIPYLIDHGIDQEDSVSLAGEDPQNISGKFELEIAVMELPRISNFTDLNVLGRVPGVRLRYVKPGSSIGQPDAVIIPGTKNSILDLVYLKEQGYAGEIKKLADTGVPVAGICGGYQMLGRMLHDPEGTEAGIGSVEGLGLLDLETTFRTEKSTHQVQAKVLSREGFWESLKGSELYGYEIHTGITQLGEGVEPLLQIFSRSGKEIKIVDGAVRANVFGTHLHGLFDNGSLLLSWINSLRRAKGLEPLSAVEIEGVRKERAYTNLAANVRRYLNLEKIYEIMELS